MSSSSLSASSSSNKTSHGNGGRSPRNDKGSMADNPRNGIGEELTRMDDRHQLSSRSSSYDEDSRDAQKSSSSGSNDEVLGAPVRNYLSQEAAVNREKDRILQRKLYSEGTGFPFSVDLANSVKRVLKEKIFPKIKLLSDLEPQFMAPDFVGEPTDQSRNICNVLIRELQLPDDLGDRINFWITYRSLVKNQLIKYRSNCVEELKKQYFKVKEMLESEGEHDDAYFRGCKELMALLEHAGNNADCDIIALREGDDSVKEAFYFFAREFLPCIVKRLVFKKFKLVNLLSEFVTISDEAFTLLLLENNVARWNAMFAAGKNKADETMPSQKFQAVNEQEQETSNGQQQRTSGRVKDGYSLKAASRYVEYFDYVEEARKDVCRDSLEMELLKRMEDMDSGKGRGRKVKRKRDGELSYFREDGTPMQIRYEAL